MRELVPQIASTLERLEPGHWSDPVRSVHGWHLVQLIAFNEPEPRSWEQVRESAEQLARDQHRRQSIERLLRDVQQDEVIFEEGAVSRLLERYGATLGAPDLSEIAEQMQAD